MLRLQNYFVYFAVPVLTIVIPPSVHFLFPGKKYYSLVNNLACSFAMLCPHSLRVQVVLCADVQSHMYTHVPTGRETNGPLPVCVCRGGPLQKNTASEARVGSVRAWKLLTTNCVQTDRTWWVNVFGHYRGLTATSRRLANVHSSSRTHVQRYMVQQVVPKFMGALLFIVVANRRASESARCFSLNDLHPRESSLRCVGAYVKRLYVLQHNSLTYMHIGLHYKYGMSTPASVIYICIEKNIQPEMLIVSNYKKYSRMFINISC